MTLPLGLFTDHWVGLATSETNVKYLKYSPGVIQ